jgi:hypothetical protein
VTWNGSATWVASEGVVEGLAIRPDRSNTPNATACFQRSGRASIHAEGRPALRPSATSSS